MDAIQQINQRIETVQSAIRGKKRRIKILKDDLAIEELETTYKDQHKIHSMRTEISKLEKDVSEGLPAQIKDAKLETKEAERAAEEAKRLLPQQEALIPEIKEASKELLEKLKETQKSNEKLLMLNQRFRAMEAKTQSGMDRDGCGNGFYSIKILIEVLKDELDGLGRKLFKYPPNFRL